LQTHLVEIVADSDETEESWADWATRHVKDNGWKAAGAAVVVAPIIPAGIGAVAVGAGLVSGVQNGIAWLRGSDSIQKIELSRSTTLHDEHGQPVQLGHIYAVHPDEARATLLIAAPDFHSTMVGEQIADLVSFIRSAVRAESIFIEVESEASGSAGGSFWSRFTLKGEAGVAKHHSVELDYVEPDIVPMAADPFWLRMFPEIAAAFQGAKRGAIKRSVSVDTTFGLSASLAEQAGIDGRWLGKQKFNIRAKFA
jgi:hypothetical protein